MCLNTYLSPLRFLQGSPQWRSLRGTDSYQVEPLEISDFISSCWLNRGNFKRFHNALDSQ